MRMESAGRRRKPQSRLRRAVKMDVTSLPNLMLSAAVCLLCWMMGYTYSAGYPVVALPESLPTWQSLIRLQPDRQTTYLIGALLYAFVAVIIQRINYKYIIVRGRRALPALFFFLFVSTNLETFPLRPVSLGLIFLVGALDQLFGSWQRPEETGRSFNISVCLSLGALMWPQTVWFIPLFWYGMYRFGSLTARGLLTSVLGVLTVSGFVGAWCLWQGDYRLAEAFSQALLTPDIPFLHSSFSVEWISPLCVVCLVIVTSTYLSLHGIENTIRTRQNLAFLSAFVGWAFILLCVYAREAADILCVLYVPASILVGYFFSDKRNLLTYLFYILILAFLVYLLLMRLWTS